MEIISIYLSKLLSLIDNGKFFIVPMKWIYKLLSFLIFLVPLFVLFWIMFAKWSICGRERNRIYYKEYDC